MRHAVAFALACLLVPPFVAGCTPPVPVVAAPSPQDRADSVAIDSIVRRYFALDLSPGVAVVVVRGDRPLYVGGLGVADRERQLPVTAETIFYIASTTKAFTGLAAAVLAGEGRLDLDAPISRYLPQLRLQPPLDPSAITVRSLLSHTHGIGNGGPVVWRTAFTGDFEGNEHLIRLLAEHPPAEQGTRHVYGNIGYNVAGLVLDEVTGRSWRDLLADVVFVPLGMTSTSAYVSRVPADRLAMPYAFNGSAFERVRYLKTDANMQAAGGMVSSPADLARWLEAQLNGGRVDERQALPAAAVAEAQRLQAAAEVNARGLRQVGYSLGWQLLLHGTDTLRVHGGGFPGFSTLIAFSLQQRVGVAVMANESVIGGGLVDLIVRAIIDRLAPAESGMRVPPNVEDEVRRMREGVAADFARRASRPQELPHPLSAYAGVYEHPGYGRLELREVNGRLELYAGAAWSAVEVFNATRNQLRIQPSGQGEVVTMEMEDGRAVALVYSGNRFVRR